MNDSAPPPHYPLRSVPPGTGRGDLAGLYHPVRIGSLELPGNLFLAPVAGYSDRAFRSLCVECGASFTYTEMVSAEALTRGSGKTEQLMRRAENETRYAVQLFGSESGRMAEATRIALRTASPDCIDINAGCPVPKIYRAGAGSALTRDPGRLGAIVAAAVTAAREAASEAACEASAREASAGEGAASGPGANRCTPIPVTVKIRSGWDENALTWKEAAEAAITAGAAAVTLHPRTRAQGYEGTSRWDLLAELSALVHSRWPGVPVFGSGDLFTPEAAARMLSETRCDGVMFARGAMGNPFIFTQTRELLVSGAYGEIPVETRLRAGWRELTRLVSDVGESVACREMRKRFCAYSKGLEGGAALRTELVRAASIDDYRTILAAHGFCPGEP